MNPYAHLVITRHFDGMNWWYVHREAFQRGMHFHKSLHHRDLDDGPSAFGAAHGFRAVTS